jgi:hypothetical protein
VGNVRSAELVGIAQPIGRYDKVCGIVHKCEVAGARSADVGCCSPRFDRGPKKRASLRSSSRIRAVEAFTKAVLHRLSRRDEVPGDPVICDQVSMALQVNSAPLLSGDHWRTSRWTRSYDRQAFGRASIRMGARTSTPRRVVRMMSHFFSRPRCSRCITYQGVPFPYPLQ